jgi:hypothetical protein
MIAEGSTAAFNRCLRHVRYHPNSGAIMPPETRRRGGNTGTLFISAATAATPASAVG